MPAAMQNYGQNPGAYYYVNDHLGTPQQLVTGTGLVVWQAAYLPYGEAQVRINLVENNLRFPGQYFDAESGLHYNWNRYYDAQTGRYISADPIGLDGRMNLYAYVGGNPVNSFDPEGLWVNPITYWKNFIKRNKDCLIDCALDQLGWTTATGGGLIAAGAPVIKTRKKFGGKRSTDGTSIASLGLTKLTGWKKLEKKYYAPTANDLLSKTNRLGGIIGRWVPVVGAAFWIYDGISFAQCAYDCEKDPCKQNVDDE